MMYLIIALVGIGGFVLSVLAFSQIIGSFQNFKAMGAGRALFVIILWAAILGGAIFLVHKFAADYYVVFYVALAIGLLVLPKKIE